MIIGNDTRRHADSRVDDSLSCSDAACEGIANILAAPSELAEATVASEADFRGLFTAFSEATAIDTEDTTEATAFQRRPETPSSSATDALLFYRYCEALKAVITTRLHEDNANIKSLLLFSAFDVIESFVLCLFVCLSNVPNDIPPLIRRHE